MHFSTSELKEINDALYKLIIDLDDKDFKLLETSVNDNAFSYRSKSFEDIHDVLRFNIMAKLDTLLGNGISEQAIIDEVPLASQFMDPTIDVTISSNEHSIVVKTIDGKAYLDAHLYIKETMEVSYVVCKLNKLYVDEDARGQRYSSKLVKCLIKEVYKAYHKEPISLQVKAVASFDGGLSQKELEAFYLRYGFKLI